MKLIINLTKADLELCPQYIQGDIVLSRIVGAVANGTPIPDNATNGQVIQTLFKPNRVERTDDDVIVENYDFNEEWWNAPYQKGGKE